jgi:soluble lytic murein transglycosylase-like protein
MAKKSGQKTTTVREHPLRVPISQKNPTGVTIRDRHPRRVKGTYLDRDEVESTFKDYDRKKLIYPGKLEVEDSEKYDELIAVWTDYFNRKLNADPPLDPDIVKALIASESDFIENPKNPKATGIIQITPETFQVLQDSRGEGKEFIFRDIRKKDLKDPAINIPMGIRWLHRKKRLADGKLGRSAEVFKWMALLK